MTEPTLHRDPNAGSSGPTIGDIAALIEADNAVSPWRRRSVPCTIRVLSRLLNCDFASLPAEPSLVRSKLKGYHPRKGSIGKPRWGNLRHDVAFMLAYAGVIAVPSRSKVPIIPIWQELLDQLPDLGDQRVLSRFARYCVDRRISPGVVDESVADAYLKGLRESSLARDPESTHRRALVAWNRACESVEGWPKERLTIPERRNWWSLPLNDYPESFQKEVEAWLEWQAGGNPFDDQARPQPLKPSTIQSRKYHVRYAAAALVLEGRDPMTITSLNDLVEPKASEIILRHLYQRHGSQSVTATHGVAMTLKIMARTWLRLLPEELEPLEDLCRRLTPRQQGMTEKNRARLRPFYDERNILRLLHFPHDQLGRVRRGDRDTRRDALKVQLAVAVELLLMAPIRVGNLASIDITRHLSWTRDGRTGIVHLAIPGQETKTGEPLEFELPKDTVRLLDAYLSDFRPRLADEANTWLFPGKNGGHKTAHTFGIQIKRTLLDGLGLEINPHLFRHLAAMLYLRAHPGGYEVVRRVLGHQSMHTTVTAYCGMEGAAATRHFDETILKLRNAPILDLGRRR